MSPRIHVIAVASLLVAACANDHAKASSDTASSPATTQTNRCAPGGTRITSGGVGLVQVGARMHDVSAECSVTDTSVTIAGKPERAHAVNVGGGTVVALSTGTADTTVTRVMIADGRYLTEQGVGVGKTVGALRKAYGALCTSGDAGKTVYMPASLPGVSFATDSTATPADSTVISAISIVGNPPRCAAK